MDAWISYLLAAIAIAYTAIASINTIAVAVLDRRREFGLQRLTGSTRRQVSKMLYLENLVIAAFGLVLGLVAACFSVFPIAIATRGWPIPSGPIWVVARLDRAGPAPGPPRDGNHRPARDARQADGRGQLTPGAVEIHAKPPSSRPDHLEAGGQPAYVVGLQYCRRRAGDVEHDRGGAFLDRGGGDQL